jgi:hypothetical protein
MTAAMIPSPTITFILDERAYALRLAHADLALAEYNSGIGMMAAETKFWDLTVATTFKFTLLLWASMLWLHPKIELEYVRQRINIDNQDEVTDVVNALLERDVLPVMRRKKAELDAAEPSDDPFEETTGSE